MWSIFSLEIARFSILILSALVVFGLFWLYFDAWKRKKNKRDVPLLMGLLSLSLSFLIQGLAMETQVLASGWGGEYLYLRAGAYLCIIIGLLLTPIEKRPELNALIGLGMISLPLHFSLPILSAIVALLYWRRASIGLEQHLSKVAFGFFVLSVFELMSLSALFRNVQSVWISRLVAPFGVINIVQYCILLIALYFLAQWTWYYLLKRLSTQLFMLSLSGAVCLSLLITGLFVTLLLKNIETESLQKLSSNAKVVASLIEEKKSRMLSETKFLAVDSVVLSSIVSGERKKLIPVVQKYMAQTGVTSLIVVDAEGKIILRGENEEERGTSLSEDPTVKKALSGESVTGFVSLSGVIGPEMRIRVAIPAGTGAIIAAQTLDNTFLDGIQKTTGMSLSIYGDKMIAATTVESGDGQNRLIGLTETNPQVLQTVWEKGEVYAQATRLGENDYLSGYVPLKDETNTLIGVLQVSESQTLTLQTAGRAVQLTFALVISIIISLSFPIYLVCQRLVAEWE